MTSRCVVDGMVRVVVVVPGTRVLFECHSGVVQYNTVHFGMGTMVTIVKNQQSKPFKKVEGGSSVCELLLAVVFFLVRTLQTD